MPNFTFVYIAWWLTWSLVQTFVLHRMGLSWQYSVTDAFVSNTLQAITCLSAIILFRFYKPGPGQRLFRLGLGIIITALYCEILGWLMKFIFPADEGYHRFFDFSIPVRFSFSFLMLTFVNVLNWMWNINKEKNSEIERKNETEKSVREAELTKLRQQLQPHFLFNSLNSISALAGSQPAEARRMIQQLSDFLRGTIKKDEQELVSLSEEINMLMLYLEIEKVRFGERLNIDIDTGDAPGTARLPPLLLQPLLENAIKFGLYGTLGAITVSLHMKLNNGILEAEIRNPFDDSTARSSNGTGFGLTSVQRRLFLIYSRNDLISTEKKENEFITRLKIPQPNA